MRACVRACVCVFAVPICFNLFPLVFVLVNDLLFSGFSLLFCFFFFFSSFFFFFFFLLFFSFLVCFGNAYYFVFVVSLLYAFTFYVYCCA